MAVVTVGLSKVSERIPQRCLACQGKALKPNPEGRQVPCPWCNGQGKVYRDRLLAVRFVMVVSG